MINSPWIDNLDRKFTSSELVENKKTEIVIVGGGISGVLTAFNILKSTNKHLILIESNRVGHGASGHNAGMMIAYVENINEVVNHEQYSKERITNTLKRLDDSWTEFHNIRKLIPEIDNYFTQVEGHSGYEDKYSILENMTKSQNMKKWGMNLQEEFYISSEIELESDNYDFKVVSQSEVDNKFPEAKNKFIGYSLLSNLGVMNSAQFVQDLLHYLSTSYKDRFEVFDKSPLKEIVNLEDKNICEINDHYIEAKNVIICTNGYKIPNIVGRDNFEEVSIQGVVNYMMGAVVSDDVKPSAYTYYKKVDTQENGESAVEGDVDYVYGTSRKMKNKTLLTFGNSSDDLVDGEIYLSERQIDEARLSELRTQAKSYFDFINSETPEYLWHGLMGYTNSRNRKLGEFPKGSGLIYNIGCNGIGIMPAIASGKLIGEYFQNGRFEDTIWNV